ncbi:bifunctional 2-polyprenyl-6-hydroxyphenol methylase/3-demethylubiquinol 3-O-methyltransferase UbiG [Pedobacter sp. BMA]|uniref:class I SAM-dependent methyltransferase n=1 Tax=Pedobacter sp. BMA TaxID=1663685 RepID=UPI00064A18F2|nr:class I SAM-dependent methyltransferase [Pedobacter sp. BMA]KLT64076.1 methyltransferase type 11 [Pedobacter sp. BMA]
MLSEEVKTAYDNFYTNSDVEWRMLGAKYKAKNIVDVCAAIKPKTVLEVGAGDGSILHFLNDWNFAPELYALEIAESGVDLIKKRNLSLLKEVQSFDGYKIPYADDSFDLIILAHVLEHVEHERILIRELKRVAKYIVVEVPKDYRYGVDNRMKHFLDYGHINMYTPTSLRFLLQSEGLEIMEDKVSMTATETVKFNEFVNKRAPKSFMRNLKIELEYNIKKTLGGLLGRKKQEQFANAYTVLTKKSDQNLHIF